MSTSPSIRRKTTPRDLTLGAGIHHPDPAVRAGAPKTSLLGVAAGAGLFVALGLTALSGRR